MATSAATLSKIISTLSAEYKLDEKKVLKHLANKELLPAKLIPKTKKGVSTFASKQAEELATKSNFLPEGDGSGKDGKWTLGDIKKHIETPSKAKLLCSPTALTFANEHKIDITKVEGTGKDGRILLKDVEKLVEDEDEEINISPTALIAAKKAKIEDKVLLTYQGSGKDGRILLGDVNKIITESENSESDSDSDEE